MADGTARRAVGMAVLDAGGKILLSSGIADDPRVTAIIADGTWMEDALERRLVPVLLNDARAMAMATAVEDRRLVLFFGELSDTVIRFFMQVDFAVDIIDHILSDPYDAMSVIDAEARVAFVSPIHEKFFGLDTGDSTGKHVRDVIQNTRLHHVVRTGVAEVGQIQKMRGSERVVSRHPIRHEGRIVGAIGRVMFKGPAQVEAMARRINTLEKEIDSYRSERRESARHEACLEAIIGQGAAIRKVRDQLRKIAPLDIPVLIQGESGTGKELVAKALHQLSPRSKERLVTVNAAALPASLVESELFGYEAGSFTGADRKGRPGKFEQADRGTIFLDEIGDMPIEVQSKLLRVLQDQMVERIGGEMPRRIDFRLCSATNRDLEKFIDEEKFRLDLFYRISPFIITLPSLCERLEDIPLLLEHFVADLAQHYECPVPEVDASVVDYLSEQAWPGNIRQLRHAIERAFVLCENQRLRVTDFQNATGATTPASRPAPRSAVAAEGGGRTLKDALGELERSLIADAMARFNGNKKKVAAHLGVSRTYLYKKLEECFEV